ncbi:T9SS sorting signal type C domain-containing protein [Flavobacterium sp. LB3P122]|uniref:T9SS sorting signal type C domain-containing protein n=1 Tax=Flavobacterium algoriphilum TaxID=3398738 RepID=UPI003A85D15F
MKIFLPNSIFFTSIFLLFAFSGNAIAQCTITSTTNASSITCSNGISSLGNSCGGILYIGNGTVMTLIMDGNLDLTCLGAIQLIVKDKATIDFSSGNFDLSLAAGSSIQFQSGSNLNGGSSCSSSDRIKIGGTVISNCQGNGTGVVDFTTLINLGGYNVVTLSPSSASICASQSVTLTATATPSTGSTIKWYTVSTGGAAITTGNTYTLTPSSTITCYAEATYSSGYITPRKGVTITVVANETVGAASSTPTLCINTVLTSITHATTGATGIGTAINLPSGLTATWASNAITIIGTPTASGTFNYSIPLTGGCGSGNATGTITVIGNNTVSTTATTSTLCINTALTNITHATTGATGIGAAINLPTGLTAAWASNKITISGTPTASGTFNYSIPLTGGCSSVNATGTITVTGNNTVGAASSTPTLCINSALANIIHPTTGATGIGTATGLPAGVNAAWASNTVTINGTPTISGTFNYSIPLTGGCSSVIATGTIIVNPNSSIASVAGTTQLCIGGTGTYSANTVVLGAGTGTWGSSKTSVATVNASGVVTGIAAGTSNIIYTITGGCGGTVFAQQSITVNALPSAPTFTSGDITQPSCSTSTGSVVLSGLPATGVWNLYQNGSVTPLITSGSGINTTITGLSAGTYTYMVSNGTCMSVVSADVVIDPVITATWNVISGVGSWTNGPPTSSKALVFNGLYSSVSNVDGCSCQVNSGNSVTILSGGTLKITNGITLLGTGILTFENTASLVQINDNAINSGNITYRRSNSTTRETDYTYWSSPVAGQTLKKVSPNTPSNLFYSFNAAVNDWKQENSANVMTIGLGYIIRGPHYTSIPPPGFYEAIFQGVPNNGNISIPIPFAGKATSNFLGNPYPSALNADLFLTTNSAVLDGTLYFWTHKTEIGIGVSNPGTGVYAYSSDDYATYNLTGGTATRTGNFVGLVEQISNKPSGKIASGQGFFVSGIGTGNAVFNNSMRISGGASGINNTQFFKATKNSKTINTIEKHRVWLNLTNIQGAFKQTLVGYVTNATNGYDDAFDGQSFDGNQFVDFYSINETENLTIQGRALPFDENDKVPLGFSSTINGVFSIAIDEVDGLLASQDIFIEDKKINCVKSLKEGAYSFSTEAGVFNDRFILRYTNANKTLRTNTLNTLENIVLVSKDKNELKIKSELENIKRITVFDLLGRKVFDKRGIESNEFDILNSTLNKQTVIVKITLTTGQIISKKVIY